MPTAPRKPCPTPSCPNLQPCPTHPTRPWDHGGRSAHQRGYGKAWQRTRLRILDRDGWLCQECARRGRMTEPATTADHIVPKALGGTDEDGNLEALCRACQQRKAGREGQAGRGE